MGNTDDPEDSHDNPAVAIESTKRPGLGQPPPPELQSLWEEQRLLSIAAELKRRLAATVEDKRAFQPWTRDYALAALKIIHEAVAGLMDELSADGSINYEHNATSLIQALIDQLQDLKYGKVGEILKPVRGVGGARYSVDDEKMRTLAVESIEIAHRSKKIPLKHAAKNTADFLKKNGAKIRGKTPTAEMLLRFRDNKLGKGRP